jgi:hypothetical protein
MTRKPQLLTIPQIERIAEHCLFGPLILPYISRPRFAARAYRMKYGRRFSFVATWQESDGFVTKLAVRGLPMDLLRS